MIDSYASTFGLCLVRGRADRKEGELFNLRMEIREEREDFSFAMRGVRDFIQI